MFGTKRDKTIELCKVYLISTLPNLYQYITMLNIDTPNCCTTLSSYPVNIVTT